MSISRSMWRQVQYLHDDILAAVLYASDLPLTDIFEHAPEVWQACCSGALEVHDGVLGLFVDMWCFHNCSAVLHSLPSDCRDLQWQDLRDSSIGVIGAAALGPHFAALSSLQSLDLSENDIGDEALPRFACTSRRSRRRRYSRVSFSAPPLFGHDLLMLSLQVASPEL